jgi:hypothetical protein
MENKAEGDIAAKIRQFQAYETKMLNVIDVQLRKWGEQAQKEVKAGSCWACMFPWV